VTVLGSVHELRAFSAGMRPVTLDEVLATASLQARIDRKYVVPLASLARLLGEVGADLDVLDIDDVRVFRYESVYFDTPDLTCYHQHAHGRRRRAKIRTRTYLDSGECLLEFKRVGSRGETVKERFPYRFESRFALDGEAQARARERLGPAIDATTLRPALTTAYLRTTLVDTVRGNRVTCDVDLRFDDSTGRCFGPAPDIAIVESKSVAGDSLADRTLRRLGARQVTLSKYCVGMAVLDHRLPANRWNRELRTHFAWAPER
jgi:hypothetical protein